MTPSTLQDLTGPTTPAEHRFLQAMMTHGAMHRAEVARLLRLSRTRAGTLATRLLERGILIEDEDPVGPNDADGRAGAPLTISPSLGSVAGVQINTGHVHVAVTTLSGTVLAQDHRDGLANLLDVDVRLGIAKELLDQAAQAARAADAPLLVGLGAFGQIDPQTGVVSTHPNDVWWGVDLPRHATKILSTDVIVQNNSRLEALAEATWGSGRGCDPMLYLQLGHGLTATLISNGQPLNGAHGGAGELGHVTDDPAGPLCACGSRGCLATTVSAGAIQRALAQHTAADTWDDILAAARAGDRTVLRVFLDAADRLGRATANLANLTDPQAIVIGGDLPLAGSRFWGRLVEQFNDHALIASGKADIRPAALAGQGRGGALAAALIARRHLAEQGDYA